MKYFFNTQKESTIFQTKDLSRKIEILEGDPILKIAEALRQNAKLEKLDIGMPFVNLPSM